MARKSDAIYEPSLIHEKITVPFNSIGNDMTNYFETYAKRNMEGRCRKEGFIKPNATTVVSYSTGLCRSDKVVYDVMFSAQVCVPYESQEFTCIIKNITKIGIRAYVSEVDNPITVYISREHNTGKNFEDYKEGQTIMVRVIGPRFELNDETVSVIAELVD